MKKYILLFVAVVCMQSVQAKSIDYVEADFAVEYNNKLTQGENHLKIQRNQNRYEIDFNLEHWLLSSSQKSIFEMNQCQVQPISYTSTSKRPLKDENIQKLDFDWTQNQVKFSSEEEQKTFNLDSALYDPLSFFFEARCELIAGKTEFSYPLIYKGNKKNHHYKVVGTEKVKTEQGSIEAIVIERERENPNRQTRLYVAPSLDYLLVKIEHQESRLLKVVSTLKHMDYQMIDN